MDISAHGFIIVDVVPEDDMQTGRHIEEGIRDAIYAESSGLFCKRYKCATLSEVVKVFNQVELELKNNGQIPFIHIEGHGSRDNLKLIDGTFLSWKIVFKHLRRINILCRNNLFFTSGACQSAYAYKFATITEPAPVFGMLAPEGKVTCGNVHDGYISFFKNLICNESMNDAFNAFSNSIESKKFALIFSQKMFEKVAYKYIKECCTGKGRKRRLEEVVTLAVKSGQQVREARRLLKKEVRRPQARYLKRSHEKFMMIDRYPENRKRFRFDAVKFELSIKSGKLKNV